MVKLEEIVEVYAAMVRRIATVYERHPDRVDDLVQDVWIAVRQPLPRLNNQATLKRLYCPHHAEYLRHPCPARPRAAGPAAERHLARSGPLPMKRRPKHAPGHLIEAVRSLPENLKAVASLYLEDMPVNDIALAPGISESNTSVRLHRAKSAIMLSSGDLS
jgi:DNA-directed RNA polymerase specialized sigma24 family protein